jgi:two-component sensor histidine kinase
MIHETQPKRSSILRRVTLMAWLVAVLSVGVFAVIMTLQRQYSVQTELEGEARSLAQAIEHDIGRDVTAKRLSAVVDHCLSTLQQEKNVVYLVVTLKNGDSLVHTPNPNGPDHWQRIALKGKVWYPGPEDENRGSILKSPFYLQDKCLHYSHPGTMGGSQWGWIHLGLSLDRYQDSITAIYRNTGMAGAVVLIIGALVAYFLARNLIKPLRALQTFAHRVAGGALNARANIDAGGEIGDLADSFNRMVESLEQHQVKLRESIKSTASLREKEILLREIHHRVKNNMQILTSLLRLQTRQTDSLPLRQVLQESEARIRSMGLLHEKLYQSESVTTIDMQGYLRTLTAELIRTNTPAGTHREVKLDVGEVNLGLDTALPCGLIITELVTNALKYAFPNRLHGTIYISLHEAPGDENFALTVWDDGIGIDNSFDVTKATSLGMRLVKMLIDQLNGKLAFDGAAGTKIEIQFKESQYKMRL